VNHLTQNEAGAQSDEKRTTYGFWVVLTGLMIVLISFLATIMKWTTAADVSTVLASITSVVGTLVGTFFGVQVGSTGKEKSDVARNNAEVKLRQVSALASQFAQNDQQRNQVHALLAP